MAGIAIIGMACIFPGAANKDEFWNNICAGKDAITSVPAHRIDPSFFANPDDGIAHFYCQRGGFVDHLADFDPVEYGIMPRVAQSVEPDQLLALRVGCEALADAGYLTRDFDRNKTGVIVGRGNYAGPGLLRLQQHVRELPQLLATLKDLFPDLTPEALQQAAQALRDKLPYYGADVASGLIPNLMASRIAHRLDLHGPAYTVDAACASSLIAVEQACGLLQSGQTDLMVVGGVHLVHDLTFWATFCQLGAFSKRGEISPLSEDADGILAGEGVGMVVLKRLDDALREGDRIYASIEGAASSSDGKAAALVAPSVLGQTFALKRAWKTATVKPEDLELLEAHGTGTKAGDETEIATVTRFFSRKTSDTPAVIGSVKSMIGHAMPASGMASLIKTAMAIHQGVLPPSLRCNKPNPKLSGSRFRVLPHSAPWSTAQAQRVAAVNAFGFGGINAHVVLRGVTSAQASVPASVEPLPVLCLAAASPAELLIQLDAVIAGQAPVDPSDLPCRLAVVEPTPKRLDMARKAVVAGNPWAGRLQIWFSPQGMLLTGGKLAFVFPGVDSTFKPRSEGLPQYTQLPWPSVCVERDPQKELMQVVLGLLAFNRYMLRTLQRMGLQADGYAGHSIGEWSAMLASGMMSQALSDQTNATLDVDSFTFPDVRFVSATCSAEQLTLAMQGLTEVVLSHDNCPNQAIACGSVQGAAALSKKLDEMGILHATLPIVSGFHSPFFEPHLAWYRQYFSKAELRTADHAVWSATLADLYPQWPAEQLDLALRHLLEPVRFRPMIERMYEAGYRVFVQVGQGSTPGFISDTLGKRPHLALHSNVDQRPGLHQLQILAAALWVEGANPDVQLLGVQTKARNASSIKLALGVPLLRVGAIQSQVKALIQELSTPIHSAESEDPVVALLDDTLRDLHETTQALKNLWIKRQHDQLADTVWDQSPFSQGALAAPAEIIQHQLDVNTNIAFVQDHTLFPQRAGWPIMADRFPVVPMTMEIALVKQWVEQWCSRHGLALKVVELNHIEAFSWLDVTEPVNLSVQIKPLDAARVQVELQGYFRCEACLSNVYPSALPPLDPLIQPRAAKISARQLYDDQWMFHGPAYQGVRELTAVGDNGIEGLLVNPEGQGALMDNMGQLAGYWVMEQAVNPLAMPIGLERVVFHAPEPEVGAMCRAQVRVVHLDELTCITHHRLTDLNGQPLISLIGWKTRRYQMDKAFFEASRNLSLYWVSQPLSSQIALFDDRYDSAILRDYMARRYLTEVERQVYAQLQPRRKRTWLAGRVAAKDAVRIFLKQQGFEPIYPQEMRIENDDFGAPQVVRNVSERLPLNLHVSITHKGQRAAAMVGWAPVGIDMEHVQSLEQAELDVGFSADELGILREDLTEPEEVAITRAWVAKEVVAKQSGRGLQGLPKDYRIQSRRGDCIQVNDQWVLTFAVEGQVIGWSLDPASSEQQSINENLT